jgi:hypothetical protein
LPFPALSGLSPRCSLRSRLGAAAIKREGGVNKGRSSSTDGLAFTGENSRLWELRPAQPPGVRSTLFRGEAGAAGKLGVPDFSETLSVTVGRSGERFGGDWSLGEQGLAMAGDGVFKAVAGLGRVCLWCIAKSVVLRSSLGRKFPTGGASRRLGLGWGVYFSALALIRSASDSPNSAVLWLFTAILSFSQISKCLYFPDATLLINHKF